MSRSVRFVGGPMDGTCMDVTISDRHNRLLACTPDFGRPVEYPAPGQVGRGWVETVYDVSPAPGDDGIHLATMAVVPR